MRASFLASMLIGSCLLGQAQPTFPDSLALPTPFFSTTPDTIQFRNGKRYIGELKEGQLEGRGMLLNPSGDTLYVGEFEDNKKHGFGRYSFSAGNVYTGEWRDNRMHGQGEMRFYTGDRYLGRWFDDRFHGQGTYYFADGGTYEGNFFEGKRHGEGTLSTAEVIYTGQWVNGLKEGEGKQTLIMPTHREVYEGTFHQDRYDGQGVWRTVKGDNITTEYEGTFVAGKRQGEGVYRIGGRTLYGTWAPDVATGQGQCRSDEGTYEGRFLKGQFHGEGRMLYADGGRYEGQWVRGQRQGQGKMVWRDGQVYEGEWLMDQPHGEGVMYLSTGKVQEGQFANGEFVK